MYQITAQPKQNLRHREDGHDIANVCPCVCVRMCSDISDMCMIVSVCAHVIMEWHGMAWHGAHTQHGLAWSVSFCRVSPVMQIHMHCALCAA